MIPDLSVEAITVSEEQASRARRLVEDSGFTNGIHVTIGDYHQMPFPDESFDVVLFLESTGYSSTRRDCSRSSPGPAAQRNGIHQGRVLFRRSTWYGRNG